MKKLSSLVPVLALLAGCTSYNPDIDVAAEQRAQNRSEIRAEIGCQFADSHAAYRECLLNTYNKNKPRTYCTTTTETGASVAVVSEGEVLPTNEAIMQQAAIRTGMVTVQPMPVVAPAPTVIPITPQETVPCTTAPGQPCTYQTTGEVYEMEVPATPCGAAECPPLMEGPKTVTVTTTETVTEKPIEVVPAPEPLPEKTWWETYQEEKAPEAPKVVCPCPDPNDPCPQCNPK